MYLPPLSQDQYVFSTWDYRKSLLRERIGLIDADVVCLQEVSPLSFDDDFSFMSEDLGYDGVELFKRGRFRPATFWKKDRVALVDTPQHKDRTLLTSFSLIDETTKVLKEDHWHVLNCHLQAGKQGGRRVRQIVEGTTAAIKTAKKNRLKGKLLMFSHYDELHTKSSLHDYPSSSETIGDDLENMKLIVCGDFNGGQECGAVRYLESGSIGPDFLEDGEQVSSKEKILPIPPLTDILSACIDRGGAPPPATLVVPELISNMIGHGNVGSAYEDPHFSADILDRLHRIYSRFATALISDAPSDQSSQMQMGKYDVERWLTTVNLRVGRGTEFRNAAKYMGWVEPSKDPPGESETINKDDRPPIFIPDDGILTLDDFVGVYLDELRQGKFWSVAWDLAALGEPLPLEDVFRARYDRMYASQSLAPVAVLDTLSGEACPNQYEPSDHLPICASFLPKSRQ